MKLSLEMLQWWEKEFKMFPMRYFRRDQDCSISKKFRERFIRKLRANGFKHVGSGLHSKVYKHPKEKVVIKVSTGEEIRFYFYPDLCAKHSRFIGYTHVSDDGNCAIQKYVNCSDEAQGKALHILEKMSENTHWNHRDNVGLQGRKAVFIDPY